jgi:hypothetical protein
MVHFSIRHDANKPRPHVFSGAPRLFADSLAAEFLR